MQLSSISSDEDQVSYLVIFTLTIDNRFLQDEMSAEQSTPPPVNVLQSPSNVRELELEYTGRRLAADEEVGSLCDSPVPVREVQPIYNIIWFE